MRLIDTRAVQALTLRDAPAQAWTIAGGTMHLYEDEPPAPGVYGLLRWQGWADVKDDHSADLPGVGMVCIVTLSGGIEGTVIVDGATVLYEDGANRRSIYGREPNQRQWGWRLGLAGVGPHRGAKA